MESNKSSGGGAPPRCMECWKGEPRRVRKSVYTYRGSCLGPFSVYDAVLFLCPVCHSVGYSRSEARSWEIQKAIEVARKQKRLDGREIRFLREVLGKNLQELANELRVKKSTVWRWERGQITDAVSRLMADYFLISMMRLFLASGAWRNRENLPRFLKLFASKPSPGSPNPEEVANAVQGFRPNPSRSKK